MASNRLISHCENLIIKIYVVGYSQRGESIIMAFLDKVNNKVLYTIVIDSFTYKNINKTYDILNQLDISSIDMLCWSHPDYDHTKGLDILINKFCNEDTKIIVPQGLNGKEYDIINYNRSDVAIVDKIIKLNKRKKTSHLTSSVTPKMYSLMDEVIFSDYYGQIEATISALSPHSSYINNRIGGNQTIQKNDLSIVLLVVVEKYKFVFCSDIENKNIQNIRESSFDNPIFIKIPHHTSTSSTELLNISKLDQKNTLACTTIYKRHNLPDSDLLERYNSTCAIVHSTGTSKAKTKNYGIVEYEFDLYDTETVYIKKYGHAHRI